MLYMLHLLEAKKVSLSSSGYLDSNNVELDLVLNFALCKGNLDIVRFLLRQGHSEKALAETQMQTALS